MTLQTYKGSRASYPLSPHFGELQGLTDWSPADDPTLYTLLGTKPHPFVALK
jgi:hypothetical protein